MTTAFVLTGGGSLGAVQVGMLQSLADHEIAPDLLVGTSVGALNATWVATHGMSAQSLEGLAQVWLTLRRQEVFPLSLVSAWHGLRGSSPGLFSSAHLRDVISTHAEGFSRIEDTDIALHIVTTNLLTGQNVTLSTGSLVDAVLASAAIPGIFPAVTLNGHYLVDGGVAHETGVACAYRLGADRIYLLPTGTPCALPKPPTTALGTAVHALTLLIADRVASDIGYLRDSVDIKVLPPLCPVQVSATDFSQAATLIERARKASSDWIDSGDIDLPAPERFLGAHDHTTDSPLGSLPRLDP